MRNYSKIILVLVVLGLFFVSCTKKEVFRFDVSKTRKAIVKRDVIMNVSVTVNIPVAETEMSQAKVETVNKLRSNAETILEIKDPEKPGIFESSEKITSAKYHISQRRDEGDVLSITMSYKNGKVSVVDKKDDDQGRFEASARQAFTAMVKESDKEALINIGERGEIRNIVADASLKKSLELNFEKSSGFFGVTFPKFAVKEGDLWQEKKILADIEGVDVSKNPVEFVISSLRLKDSKLNGQDVAVFQSSYLIDKKEVSGVFGGFPTVVDIKNSGTTKNYYNKATKTFVKTVVDTSVMIVSSEDKKDEKGGSSVEIDIRNSSHSVTIEKVD